MHYNGDVANGSAVCKPAWEPYIPPPSYRIRVSPFLATHPKNHAYKSLICHTSINKRLKVLYLPHIQNRGVKKYCPPLFSQPILVP